MAITFWNENRTKQVTLETIFEHDPNIEKVELTISTPDTEAWTMHIAYGTEYKDNKEEIWSEVRILLNTCKEELQKTLFKEPLH